MPLPPQPQRPDGEQGLSIPITLMGGGPVGIPTGSFIGPEIRDDQTDLRRDREKRAEPPTGNGRN